MVDYPIIFAIIMVYMSAGFFIAVRTNRNDIADVFWGIGFILAAATAVVITESPTPRGALVFTLVVLWGTRLAIHIGFRNRGRAEDARYRKWREEWGSNWRLRTFFQIFMLQGFLLFLIAVPVVHTIQAADTPWTFFDVLGILVWTIGFLFEAVSDYQLARFKNDRSNAGKFIQHGLWKYSRHPNYFGEVTLWWGLYLIALSTSGGWMTLLGPATITLLILKVSGIPLLERKYLTHPDFQEYARRTSIFFPLPPRKTGGSCGT